MPHWHRSSITIQSWILSRRLLNEGFKSSLICQFFFFFDCLEVFFSSSWRLPLDRCLSTCLELIENKQFRLSVTTLDYSSSAIMLATTHYIIISATSRQEVSCKAAEAVYRYHYNTHISLFYDVAA